MTIRLDLHFATIDIVDWDILSTEVRNHLKFCARRCECTIDEHGRVSGLINLYSAFIYMVSTAYDVYIRKGV